MKSIKITPLLLRSLRRKIFSYFGLFVFGAKVDAVAPHLANSIGQDLLTRCTVEVAPIGVRNVCHRYNLTVWPGGGRRHSVFPRLSARYRCRQLLGPRYQLEQGESLLS